MSDPLDAMIFGEPESETSSPGLPFEITVQRAGKDHVVAYAVVDGERITSERYPPGSSKRRKEIAGRWCKMETLTNGSTLSADEVIAALDAGEMDAEDEPVFIEGSSHVGDQIAELGWNYDSGSADFIVYDPKTGSVTRTDSIDSPYGTIVPPTICTGIVSPGSGIPGTVLVPSEVDDGHEDRLRKDIAAFVNAYVELPGDAVYIAVEYVLMSWVFDRFDELPYLAFRTADLGRGKSRALETVGSICRLPMLCGGGSSAAATLRLCDVFGGTLIADEFDFKRNSELACELGRILNQGFQKNRPLIKCDGEDNAPTAFACYGPKLFALRSTLGDDATETRTISIWMKQRTRADVPISLPRRQFDEEALTLRNRLIGWRFANLGRVQVDPALADDRLEDRSNQIGLPLLSIARTAITREKIVNALMIQQSALASDRSDALPGEALAAVLQIAKPGDAVRPADVAAKINEIRADAEDMDVDKLKQQKLAVTAIKIGWVLKDLELPRRRDRRGTEYILDENRIDLLKKRFALYGEGTPVALPPLQHCNCNEDRHAENGVLDSASADPLQCDKCGNAEEACQDKEEDCHDKEEVCHEEPPDPVVEEAFQASIDRGGGMWPTDE